MSDEPEVEEIAPCPPKIIPWVEFEREVAEYIENSIAEGKRGVIAVQSKVYRKPKYYSKDRESHIIFDASIEVRPEQAPEQLHFLWLIECKNYPTELSRSTKWKSSIRS